MRFGRSVGERSVLLFRSFPHARIIIAVISLLRYRPQYFRAVGPAESSRSDCGRDGLSAAGTHPEAVFTRVRFFRARDACAVARRQSNANSEQPRNPSTLSLRRHCPCSRATVSLSQSLFVFIDSNQPVYCRALRSNDVCRSRTTGLR